MPTFGRLPVTDNPVADLIAAGTCGFRRFALAHPALFQVGVQQTWLPTPVSRTIHPAAGRALTALYERLRRAGDVGGLGDRAVDVAAVEFHALCEGLASVELRGFLPTANADYVWGDALTSLIAGWQPDAATRHATS